MLSAVDTAYPLLKASPSARELNELYTPNLFEIGFAEKRTREATPRVGLLLLLKTFQRLGYFVKLGEIQLPLFSTSRTQQAVRKCQSVYQPTTRAPLAFVIWCWCVPGFK